MLQFLSNQALTITVSATTHHEDLAQLLLHHHHFHQVVVAFPILISCKLTLND